MKRLAVFFCFLVFISCDQPTTQVTTTTEMIIIPAGQKDSINATIPQPSMVNTKDASPSAIVDFAETLIGVPYKYGSIDPSQGFDCSGFITYVFNHFDIKVPRSSIDFTNIGKEIQLPQATRGDLILFTGTDSLVRIVGHMGIVTGNTDSLRFIHSTSGKKYGVTITALNKYYLQRFVKVTRIF